MSNTSATRRADPIYEYDTAAVGSRRNPVSARDNLVTEDTYSPKMVGPKYPAHDANGPMFEGKDIAGLIAGTIITLGPLAAYSFGFGL